MDSKEFLAYRIENKMANTLESAKHVFNAISIEHEINVIFSMDKMTLEYNRLRNIDPFDSIESFKDYRDEEIRKAISSLIPSSQAAEIFGGSYDAYHEALNELTSNFTMSESVGQVLKKTEKKFGHYRCLPF